MKLIYQDRFGYPDGNCLAACIASIFEIELSDVPDFGIDDGWYKRFTEFMVQRFGLQPIDIHADQSFAPLGYHIINGDSPRGLLHSVVGNCGEMVHDPHPGGGGVSGELTYTLFTILDWSKS